MCREFILAKDASLSYDSATGNAKKESLGLTSILDGEFVSVLDGEHGGTPVFVDSPEELSFGPIAEVITMREIAHMTESC